MERDTVLSILNGTFMPSVEITRLAPTVIPAVDANLVCGQHLVTLTRFRTRGRPAKITLQANQLPPMF